MNPFATALCACFLGIFVAAAVEWLSSRERMLLQMPQLPRIRRLQRVAIILIATIALVVSFSWASVDRHCLDTTEVRPSAFGIDWRLIYHAALLSLLVAATAIDFDCYMIPDAITVTGAVIGIGVACFIQEVQICHLWVDWAFAVPQLRGPLIPGWYVAHPFWHALALSVAGLVVGAGLTQVSRVVSSFVLGVEAMGFGDVMLMAMIGSFLGWQAVTLVFMIAPLTGLTIGILLRMLTGKPYLPYGPWLSIAAVIVMFGWSELWLRTRLIFSDWMSLALLCVIGGVGFVFLLWLVRLYKSIPTRRSNPSEN